MAIKITQVAAKGSEKNIRGAHFLRNLKPTCSQGRFRSLLGTILVDLHRFSMKFHTFLQPVGLVFDAFLAARLPGFGTVPFSTARWRVCAHAHLDKAKLCVVDGLKFNLL